MKKSINKLKAYRTLHDVRQEEIANFLGISLSTYNYKENGSRKFSVDEAKKICDYFKVSIEEIFFSQSVNIMDTKIEN